MKALLAGGAALLVAAGACSFGGDDAGPTTTNQAQAELGFAEADWTGDTGPTVVVIGDSITHFSRAALHTALAGYRVRIGAVSGEGFAGGIEPLAEGERPVMQDVAADYAALDPDVAVIALGTNDALLPANTAEAAGAALATMADELGDACIVAVRVYEGITLAGFDPGKAAAINAALASVADQVVDTAPIASTIFEPDHVHPPPDATDDYAALVADAVHRCAPPAP